MDWGVVCLFCFPDRVSLCASGYPVSSCIDQICLYLRSAVIKVFCHNFLDALYIFNYIHLLSMLLMGNTILMMLMLTKIRMIMMMIREVSQ